MQNVKRVALSVFPDRLGSTLVRNWILSPPSSDQRCIIQKSKNTPTSTHPHTPGYAHTHSRPIHTRTHTRTHMHTHIHTHTNAHAPPQSPTHTHTQVHTRQTFHTHTRTHTHTHVRTHTSKHTYIHSLL